MKLERRLADKKEPKYVTMENETDDFSIYSPWDIKLYLFKKKSLFTVTDGIPNVMFFSKKNIFWVQIHNVTTFPITSTMFFISSKFW